MQVRSHEPSHPHQQLPATETDQIRQRRHEEALLDEALAATFPCSDPISTLSVDDGIHDPGPPSKS